MGNMFKDMGESMIDAAENARSAGKDDPSGDLSDENRIEGV